MNSRIKAVLLLLATLVAGIALGVTLDHYFIHFSGGDQRRDHRRGSDFVERFSQDLELDKAQQEKFKVLLQDLKNKYGEIRKNCAPQYKQVRNEFNHAFSEILTAKQKVKFDEFIANHEKARSAE